MLGKAIQLSVSEIRVNQPDRGWLLQLMPIIQPYLDDINDIHIVTLEPGIVRGNHYHRQGTEVLIPLSDQMTIAWQEGDTKTEVASKDGNTIFIFPPEVPHAIRNDSPITARLIAIGNRAFDPDYPDRFAFPLLTEMRPANKKV